jgi:hypothetical protein
MRLAVMTASLLLDLQVRADAVGHSSVFDCSASSDRLVAEHHHDWSEITHDARWKMINTDKDIFKFAEYILVPDRKRRPKWHATI